MGEAVLDHGQHVEGRIGKILKPLTTPVHCTGREKNKQTKKQMIVDNTNLKRLHIKSSQNLIVCVSKILIIGQNY